MFRKKWPWVIGVLLIAAIAGAFYSRSRQEKGTLVTAENVQRRDLESLVSASGKIDPKPPVNISAQSMGRVTRLGVQRRRPGQGRPVPAADRSGLAEERRAPRRSRGGRAPAPALEQSRVDLQSAQASLDLARQALQAPAGTVGSGPDHARDAGAGAGRSRRCARATSTRASRRSRPAKSRCGSSKPAWPAAATPSRRCGSNRPFDGIVTRRNVEEGENVVVGTMNNAGTVLLTVADMSVIEAEVEVDETDIPLVQIGQKAARSPSTPSPAGPSPATSPRSATARSRPPAPPPASERPPTSRWSSPSTRQLAEVRPGLHLHRRDHHRHARAAWWPCRSRR